MVYDSGDDEAYSSGGIILYSRALGLHNMTYSLHWAAVGSFRISPVLFQQLYTVHATVLGITVPCAYALLEDKSAHTHRQGFSSTSSSSIKLDKKKWFPNTVVSDCSGIDTVIRLLVQSTVSFKRRLNKFLAKDDRWK